jgi:hypothetical protein
MGLYVGGGGGWGERWTGLMWLTIGKMAGSCEHGNESSAFVKWVEFFDWLKNC